ncbi:MAG: hypothetical protein ACE5KG_03600 [Nitrososphaerales archaeon]
MPFKGPGVGKIRLEGDAAKAYHTVQRHNPVTLDELALQARIPRHKILRVVKELEREKLLELSQVLICQISDNAMTISKSSGGRDDV